MWTNTPQVEESQTFQSKEDLTDTVWIEIVHHPERNPATTRRNPELSGS